MNTNGESARTDSEMKLDSSPVSASDSHDPTMTIDLSEASRSTLSPLEGEVPVRFENPQLDFSDSGGTVENTDEDEIAMTEVMLEALNEDLPEPRVEAGPELLESLRKIPDKMAFKIGEAAAMVGVKQYVLRYWESEFDALRPRKSKNNQRVYSRRDVETAMMIKKLLYDDRFSIEGARSALRTLKSQVKDERGLEMLAQSHESAVLRLKGLVAEIRRIRAIFS